ncbi:MAG: hypothetical protein NTW74_03140 [Acidobacteria bacterium]|nr:hypothetical protein [Acidobacteriota bacterium]
MKARNREINIFNMSLLDILCGALGVFCFMTLVLFPYWRPTGANAEDLEKNKLAIEQEMKELKKKLSESVDGKRVLQQVEQLEQRLQQQQGDLNKAQQELKAADKVIEKLEMRNPVAVSMKWNGPQDIDLFLEPANYGGANGQRSPRMDVNKKQGTSFQGECLSDYSGGPATEIWLQRDTVVNGEVKVYYKYFSSNGNAGPVNVGGYFLSDDKLTLLPNATIEKEHSAAWVGTLITDKNHKMTFEAAPEYKASYAKQLEAFGRRDEKGAGQ